MSASAEAGGGVGPLSLAPSLLFDGNDGHWSTFNISVGTPPQYFRVLPSTVGQELWVPVPEGCTAVLPGVTDCGSLRGVDDFNGGASLGFQINASSTQDTIGLYHLATPQNLTDPSDAGFYALDTVGLTSNGTTTALQNQIVAGIATPDFFLGEIGLGTRPGNFSVLSQSVPSLLVTLKAQNITPSLSYGYTAGGAYASNGPVPGSLTLGGYDQARYKSPGISLGLDPITHFPAVGVQSIVATNTLSGTLSLLPSADTFIAPIDSAYPHIWLARAACDEFETAFGLTYDARTDLYLVNNTIRSRLLQLSPSITVAIGQNASGAPTSDVVLPYAAFDLEVGLPIYNSSTRYFPIRRAANDSQLTLGRTFLQEAYLTVDWERSNFAVAQAVHQNSTVDVVPILAPSTLPAPHKLSAGAIAGTVIGAVLVVAGVIGAAIWAVRLKRRRLRVAAGATEMDAEKKADVEDGATTASKHLSSRISESDPLHVVPELGGKAARKSNRQLPELQGDEAAHELSAKEKTQPVYELS